MQRARVLLPLLEESQRAGDLRVCHGMGWCHLQARARARALRNSGGNFWPRSVRLPSTPACTSGSPRLGACKLVHEALAPAAGAVAAACPRGLFLLPCDRTRGGPPAACIAARGRIASAADFEGGLLPHEVPAGGAVLRARNGTRVTVGGVSAAAVYCVLPRCFLVPRDGPAPPPHAVLVRGVVSSP